MVTDGELRKQRKEREKGKKQTKERRTTEDGTEGLPMVKSIADLFLSNSTDPTLAALFTAQNVFVRLCSLANIVRPTAPKENSQATVKRPTSFRHTSADGPRAN
jgi:hypothetical protein